MVLHRTKNIIQDHLSFPNNKYTKRESLTQTFWDAISVSVLGFACFPLIMFLLTHRISFIWFALGILYTDIIATALRHFLHWTYKDVLEFKRPLHATNCNIFNNSGDNSGQAGFPSGHVTVTTFFLTFCWLESLVGTSNLSFVVTSACITFLVAQSRVQKKCHTYIQTIAGVVFGILMAFIWAALGKYLDTLLVCM